MTAKTVSVTVRRGSADDSSWTETFDVPYRAGMSALDALIWIRGHIDGSLAFRYSCINANACKECMMRIDGRTQYACMARLTTTGTIVEPLPNKPLIRDLVTDIVPPKERL